MITIKWDDDNKRVMVYEFEGAWSVEDLIEAMNAGAEVINRYNHAIDVVVDLSASGAPTLRGINIRQAFQQANEQLNTHIASSAKTPGMIVVVAKNAMIRSTLTSLLRMMQPGDAQMTAANTRDQARQVIADFRAGSAAPVTST